MIVSEVKEMTAEQLAKLAKQKAAEEKKAEKKKEAEAKKREKAEESEDDFQVRRWNAFIKAEQVMTATDMKFYRDAAPKYFRSLTTTLEDIRTGVEIYNTEIKFYPPSSLKENWIELDDDLARKMFRTMVEGGEIEVRNPETGQFIKQIYPPRVFDKITNTLKQVDEKTYNLLRLDDRLKPNYAETDVPKISPYMRALVNAISGNVIEWNASIGDWVGDKEENRVWFEKWIYGAVYADIGNPTASLPVIYGKGKVGKNALFDIVFKQILGKESCFSSTWDVLHGNFDGFKMNKVVMFIDEVPARNDWSTFKNMTGSPDSFVKLKYGAEFTIENTIRYVIGCNEETYPLPVEDGAQMMRVSPIKTQRSSTFATNFVKIMNQETGNPDFCKNLLADSDPTLDLDELTDFEIGDLLLRGPLHREWASRESAQNFLNYLDYTYKSETGLYNNPPLRGRDWAEVIEEKESTVNKIVQYVLEEEIEIISTIELYEIYKILQEHRSDVKMKFNGFAAKIKPLLLESGLYEFHQNPTIKDGSRVGLYCISTVKPASTAVKPDFKNYEINSAKFIVEVDLYKGNSPWQKKQPMLKYKDGKTKRQDRGFNHLNRLINPEKD
jgi:hypothetical protein